jgi:hypothetical protein
MYQHAGEGKGGRVTTVEKIKEKYDLGNLHFSAAEVSVLLDALTALEGIRERYAEAVDIAGKFLQAGGRYSHLIKPGDSILNDGIPALVNELRRVESLNKLVESFNQALNKRADVYLGELIKVLPREKVSRIINEASE